MLAVLLRWSDTQQSPMLTSDHWLIPGTQTMLKNIATELAEGGGDDELEAADDLKALLTDLQTA